jgi:hypothetical protein
MATLALTGLWPTAMPDVLARIERAQRARVADVGCRDGASTLALAGVFPDAHVDGIDHDADAIAGANARAAGLDGRVRFGASLGGPYVDDSGLGALGTVVRGRFVRRVAADAGFRRVGALWVEDGLLRQYRLDP